jgi:hypothetical protein
MTILSRIRYLAFLVAVVGAMASGRPVSAFELCDSFGSCEECSIGEGRCYLWEGGSCEQYMECTTVGYCLPDQGGSVPICYCGECQG